MGIQCLRSLDAMAPGVLVAQAIGRWGNWFNQELFGRPTDLPWALKIDPAHRPPRLRAVRDLPPDVPLRVLWDLGAFGFVIWADRRFRLGHGRVVALYVMPYTLGRGWIEMLRIDDVQYQHVLGLRLNVWTSIVLFCLAATYFVVVGREHPGRETVVYTEKRLAADQARPRRPSGGSEVEPDTAGGKAATSRRSWRRDPAATRTRSRSRDRPVTATAVKDGEPRSGATRQGHRRPGGHSETGPDEVRRRPRRRDDAPRRGDAGHEDDREEGDRAKKAPAQRRRPRRRLRRRRLARKAAAKKTTATKAPGQEGQPPRPPLARRPTPTARRRRRDQAHGGPAEAHRGPDDASDAAAARARRT